LHGSSGILVLAEGENLLGRARECRLLINDPRLSRHHAKLVQRGDAVHVEDMGSRNGVLVNGERIAGPTPLAHGDVMVCGPCRFVCSLDPTGDPSPPTTAKVRPGHDASSPTRLTPSIGTTSRIASRSRSLDRQIAAVVGSSSSDGSAATSNSAESPSERWLRPDDAAEPGTGVLSKGRPPTGPHEAQRPSVYQTTGIAPHDAPARMSTALMSQISARPDFRLWAAATLGDLLFLGLTVVVVLVPIAWFGYAAALHTAGAALDGDIPRLGHAGDPAGWYALITALSMPTGWTGLDGILSQISGSSDRSAFAVLFATITAMLLAAALTVIFTSVRATVHGGGPWCHRALRLEIIATAEHAWPSWERATLRWLLMILFLPLALVVVPFGWRGVPDALCGCDVRRRP
jgi:hypothetical protein